jgi:lipopolysaccharide biosynthesis glycosyltransferase
MRHSTERATGRQDNQARPAIVFACDVNYAMQLATTLRSLADAVPKVTRLDIHVLTDGFPAELRRRVAHSLPAEAAPINWVDVDLEPFRGFSTLTHISKMTYARLLIPHVLPTTVSRLLYLDADLLVLDDIDALWTIDLEGCPVAAVLDVLDPLMKRSDPRLRTAPRVRNYFNSGVLLIDLARWREEQLSERAIDYLDRCPQSPFKDQDALNVACDDLWKKLDPRWNFQDHFHTNIADIDDGERPAIVHFVTSNKPWNPGSLSMNASLYNSFRNRTQFAKTSRERSTDAAGLAFARCKRWLRQYAAVERSVDLMRQANRGSRPA